MIIPCKDCLIIPICKHKIYRDLVRCDTLRRVLYKVKVEGNHVFSIRLPRYYDILDEVQKLMNPQTWKVEDNFIKTLKEGDAYPIFYGWKE